jgi:formylglycine-generating enzyme required for sulfatase activity
MSFAVGEVVQKLRWIPPGRFTMGSPESEAGRYEDEGPQHEVELTEGFWLAETLCTQALWQAVMGENPSHIVGPDLPIEQVSWEDCQEFFYRLNQRIPELQARLPSEADWEYACRAGTTTATWVGDLTIGKDRSAPELEKIAWYGANSGGQTHPVRTKAVNPWGLYDMLGNVLEWCQDWFGPYDGAVKSNPMGPEVGSERVLRGGAWYDDARFVRAALRDGYAPGIRFHDLGFRVARGRKPGI